MDSKKTTRVLALYEAVGREDREEKKELSVSVVVQTKEKKSQDRFVSFLLLVPLLFFFYR
jgi:hypothetical protein